MSRPRTITVLPVLVALAACLAPGCGQAEIEALRAERAQIANERDEARAKSVDLTAQTAELGRQVEELQSAATAAEESAAAAQASAAQAAAEAARSAEERIEELSEEKGRVESHREELVQWVGELLPLAEKEDPRLANLRAVTTEIQALVAQYRGLEFRKPLMRRLILRDQVKEFMRRDAEREMPREEAAKSARVLAEFGLVPPGTDLFEINESLMEGGALAFYNPLTTTFYLIEGKNDRGDRPVVFHELVHALEDQHFDLEALQESREGDSDAGMAIKGLVEGSAERLTNLYGADHGDDMAAMMAAQMTPEGIARQVQMLAKVPPVVMASMGMFPYKNGAQWLAEIGVETNDQLDAVYRAPPTSTEQILHPGKFREDEPQTVAAPDLADVLGDGWEILEDDTLGELGCGILLATNRWNPQCNAMSNVQVLMAMMDPQTQGVAFRGSIGSAAAGWDGDRYTAASRADGSGTVIAWASVWDSDDDAQEFAAFYASLVDMRAAGKTRPSNDVALPARATRTSDGTVSAVEVRGDRVAVVLSAPAEKVDALLAATWAAEITQDDDPAK